MTGLAVRPDHVAIYVRWSTDDQAAGTTLEVQREACVHFVRSQGWQPREDLFLVDDGYSGATLDRPGMARLRTLVAEGAVDCVVVLKVDRLSRNIVDAVHLVLREWENRCHLKSVREPIDTATDLGRMIFGLLAMFADFERAAIRDRTQGGKIRRIRNGEQMHARPAFGYAAAPGARGRWVEEPAEAAVVRRIFRLAAEGESAAAIARRLNGEGLRSRAGHRWGSRSVLWILRNRTYMGEVVYGRTSLQMAPATSGGPAGGTAADRAPDAPRRIRVQRSEPLVCAPTRAAPALVPPSCFQRVQERLAGAGAGRRTAGVRSASSPHPLVGLARCPCGAPMVFKTGRARPDGAPARAPVSAPARAPVSAPARAPVSASAPASAYGYYVCARSRTGSCAAGGHVPAAAAEAAVDALLGGLLNLQRLPAGRFEQRLREIGGEVRSLQLAAAAARREGARLQADEQRLLARARAGGLALGQMAELRASIVRQREASSARLAELLRRRDQMDGRAQQARLWLSRDGAAAVLRGRLSPADGRRLLRACLAGPVVLWRQPGGARVEIAVSWALLRPAGRLG